MPQTRHRFLSSDIVCYQQSSRMTANRVRGISRCALVLAVVITSVVSANGDVCVYKPPAVRRISGVVVDQQHVSIAGVTVTVLERGTALDSVRTNDAGAFDFDIAKPGKYEIDVSAAGFRHARYELTLLRPTKKKWKHALRIEMEAGGIHCEGDAIRVTALPQSGR